MSKVKPWLNINDYIDYREPNLDRSTYTKSNYWSFGMSDFMGDNFPHKEFDQSKCPVCGGVGTKAVIREDSKGKRRGIKRIIPCPENCEHTIRW